jgi:NRPS condensation-like uncharacterized protein
MDYQAEIFDRMQLLYGESGFNDHMLHCEMRLDSYLDEATLKKATALTLASIPILATRYSNGPSGAFWESVSGDELERAFATVEDEVGFEAERTWRIREKEGPQLRVGFLRGERSAVAVTMNHMITDGAGLKECLYFLCETYSRLLEDPGYRPPLVDGYRGMGDVTRSFGPWAKLRALFGRGGANNRSGEFAFPLTDVRETSPFIATRTLDREKTSALKAYCKGRGATLNDAVLAAHYRALARAIGGSSAARLEVPVMIDMRRYLPSREFSALRNLSSTAITRLALREGESFEASLLKAKTLMDEFKRSPIGLGAFVKMSWLSSLRPARMADGLMRRGFRHPLICMTNIGELDSKRLRFGDSRILSAYACGSIKYKPHFQLALSGFEETITLSSNLYGGAEDKRKVEAYLEDVEGELDFSARAP